MMKKIAVILMLLTLTFSMTACRQTDNPELSAEVQKLEDKAKKEAKKADKGVEKKDKAKDTSAEADKQ